MTAIRVRPDPINAKSGTDQIPQMPMFSHKAKEAPRAAPADTPSV